MSRKHSGISSKKASVSLVFGEEVIENPNSEDDVMGTGALIICVGLKFPKELLGEFKNCSLLYYHPSKEIS